MLFGYDWNDGGISNQKLALLGLVIEASRNGADIYLPKIYSKDISEQRSGTFSFESVFWREPFEAFANRWNVKILPEPSEASYADRIERCGWNFFNSGAWNVSHLRIKGLDPSDITADFFRSLRPKVADSVLFSRIATFVFHSHQIDTVVQTRYEEDWRIHSQYTLEPTLGRGEDYCIPPEIIMDKVASTFAKVPETVYISCDEKHMPMSKSDTKRMVFEKSGINSLWKSDLLSDEEYNEMTPLDASLIDFELAKTAERFVGLSRSTFANLVSFERFSFAYRNRDVDFIYNLPGKLLGRRLDAGTADDPLIACGMTAVANGETETGSSELPVVILDEGKSVPEKFERSLTIADQDSIEMALVTAFNTHVFYNPRTRELLHSQIDQAPVGCFPVKLFVRNSRLEIFIEGRFSRVSLPRISDSLGNRVHDFEMRAVSQGRVALVRNSLFLSADPGGTISCDRTEASEWEFFEVRVTAALR